MTIQLMGLGGSPHLSLIHEGSEIQVVDLLTQHQFQSGVEAKGANLVQCALLHQGRFSPPPAIAVVEELHHVAISHPLKALLPRLGAGEQPRDDAATRTSGETGNLHRHPRTRSLRFRWVRNARVTLLRLYQN